MSPTTSAFLNVLRLFAAFAVFVTHCAQFWFPAAYESMARLGHDAVIIFFVLSGFVIAHSASGKQKDLRTYAIVRLSRLYSVVAPALVLTFLLQTVGTILNPEFYKTFDRGSDGFRYLISGLFLQEMWGFSASPPTNSPLWSLGYEFWYYAIFGAAIFVRPLRWRIVVVTVLMLLIGPKVLLLMPIWLAGAVAYWARKTPIKATTARWMFFVCILLLPASFTLPEFPGRVGGTPMFFSAAFLTDWIAGVIFACALWCFEPAFGRVSVPAALQNVTQRAADCTFSLYLYHYPLVLFATAILSLNAARPVQAVGVGVLILALIAGLSFLTEARRGLWRRAFERTWNLAGEAARRAGVPVPTLPAASRVR